jgi:hypothetical protein
MAEVNAMNSESIGQGEGTVVEEDGSGCAAKELK